MKERSRVCSYQTNRCCPRHARLTNNTPQTPTVDALEQKAKAGEVISLTDLAEAIKTDRENGRGKKAAAKEKPSIRAQLKADKERTGKKKPTKQKSQDLERS